MSRRKRRPSVAPADAFADIAELRTRDRPAALRRLARDAPDVAEMVRHLLRYVSATEDPFLEPGAPVRLRLPEEDLGRVLGGRWRLDAVLGVGGSAVVYDASDTTGGRGAALKLVQGLTRRGVARARCEIALLRWLRLPGVVRLLDDGDVPDGVYYVMERVDGLPFPGAGRGRSWDALRPVAADLVRAVAAMHAAGIVHRDLKPGNVLVRADGRVTIIDLGISADVADGAAEAALTPAYAPPEQRRRARPDARSDLYAIGVMLYEALAGRRPPTTGRPSCAALPAPPAIRRLVADLLAPNPRRRPRDAFAVLERIEGPAPRPRRRARWTERELRGRFRGPDRFHHLREDAAAELFRRTQGRPAHVERELGTWVRAGLAHLDDGLVVVSRPSLERLRVLTRSGSGLRFAPRDADDAAFVRELRTGTPRSLARAALQVVRKRIVEGRASAAMAAAFEAATAARRARDGRLEIRSLTAAAAAALLTTDANDFDRVLLLLQRTRCDAPEVADLERIVRAVTLRAAGRVREALTTAEEVCRRSRSPHVERLAWSVRHHASRALGIAEERRCVRALGRWLTARRVRGARSIHATATGWLRYQEARFGDAAAQHVAAAEAARDAVSRLRCLVDAATAAVDGGVAGARALALRARRLAASLRHPVHEARAAALVRAADHATGRAARADEDFVDAVAALGVPSLAAAAALTEAAVALRSGDADTARRLADAAGASWGASPVAAFAAALAAAAAGHADDRLVATILDAAPRLPPLVTAQTLALLARARPDRRRAFARTFVRLTLPRDAANRARRREVLSLDEVEDLLGVTAAERSRGARGSAGPRRTRHRRRPGRRRR